MSEFENTNLPFLEKVCIETFGKEQGKKVFDKTIEIYRELTGKADYRNNQAIRYHMTVKLFPAMSYYKALQAFGIDDAIEKVRIETQKAALINKQNNAKFARMPFVFTMYRMGVKKHMTKNFPPEGWETEWVRCDGKEIHFNLCSCLYYDCHIFLWALFIKYCYTTKFNFSFQKGFDGYCDYFLADCFICE